MNKTLVLSITAVSLASLNLYQFLVDAIPSTTTSNQICSATGEDSANTPMNENKPSFPSMVENSLVQKNVPAAEPLLGTQEETLEVKPKTENEIQRELALSQYPEFFQAELSILTNDNYYVSSVINSNIDNKFTSWSNEFQNFIMKLDSYNVSGILDEQVKCSSKACIITAKVKSKAAAEEIYKELTEKHQLWGVGIGGHINEYGEYVMYISKTKLDNDPFSKSDPSI